MAWPGRDLHEFDQLEQLSIGGICRILPSPLEGEGQGGGEAKRHRVSTRISSPTQKCLRFTVLAEDGI